ncbi:hypothetical protein Tco_1071510, partial [Tanacetum coccineum]
MGIVSRWFRGVLRMKKDKENIDNSNAKRKKRWSFGKCMKDPSQRATVENDSTRMRSCMSASEKEQNKHAMSIATTATAAADAAMAAHKLWWLLSDFLATAGRNKTGTENSAVEQASTSVTGKSLKQRFVIGMCCWKDNREIAGGASSGTAVCNTIIEKLHDL